MADAICRTGEDAGPTDAAFDDPVQPGSGSGEHPLVRANDLGGDGSGSYDSAAGGEGRVNVVCDPPEAYFCVADTTGDSFVLKLTEQEKIDHARYHLLVRGTCPRFNSY